MCVAGWVQLCAGKCLRTSSLGVGTLIYSVCQFPRRKHSNWSPFQATKMISLKAELRRETHHPFFQSRRVPALAPTPNHSWQIMDAYWAASFKTGSESDKPSTELFCLFEWDRQVESQKWVVLKIEGAFRFREGRKTKRRGGRGGERGGWLLERKF